MIDYFYKQDIPVDNGTRNFSSFRIPKEYYTREMERITRYAYQREYIINGSHILSRLIKASFIDFFMDDLVFYKILEDKVPYIHKMLGFASIYNKGSWHYNNSYLGSSELFYWKDEMIKIFEIRDTWEDLTPIEILYTDNSTFDFPFINTNIKKENIFIYKINISLLIMQYKIWGEKRIRIGLEPTVSTFINSFIYPKLLISYIDNTLLNHFCSLINNFNSKLEFKNTMPIGISDYTGPITKTYKDIINTYTNKKINIDKILLNIPVMFKNSMYDVLNVSDVGIRIQCEWIRWFIRIQYSNSIVNLLGPQGELANTHLFSGDLNEWKEFKNKNLTLPNNTKKEINEWFFNEMSKYYE